MRFELYRIAKGLCREVIPMFWVAPALALTTGGASFVLANAYDFPPGQVAVALLSAGVGAAWGVRRLRSAGLGA